MSSKQKLKVAIVHDWLTSYSAGATRVVYQLHQMYPDAPIYTSVYDAKAVPQFADAKVITSFIQKLPWLNKRHQLTSLLRQRAFEKFDFSDYDLVISSSGSEAKGIITGPDTMHINYCHSPTHYYWHNHQDYLDNPGFGFFDPIARFGLKMMVKRARKWDYEAAQRPDLMIANSSFIKKQIKKYYDREATVIHPPVDLTNFKATSTGKQDYFLIFGRQVVFKKMALAVQACSELGVNTVVAGNGPEHEYLRSIAGPSVSFETDVSEQRKQELFASAKAFIMANEEDFGVVMVESLAAGTPVVAYTSGGAEDILDEKNSVKFSKQTVAALKKALSDFDKKRWDYEKIRTSAQRFSAQKFDTKLKKFIHQNVWVDKY